VTETDYEQLLAACGGRCEPISRRASADLLRGWRQVYAAGLFAATGRWSRGGLEWHVFSFGHARALCGEPAIQAYEAERPPSVIVYPQSRRLPAVRLIGGAQPNFRPVHADVLVWPEDLAWTLAFTHEESLGLGPYFSRRDWL
jgi:hypothetical protein